MQTIVVLNEEHRLIEEALGGMELFARMLDGGAVPDEKSALARIVRLLSEYVDHFHHGKEEGILFAAAVTEGVPVHAGLIAVMNQEHDELRHLVRVLSGIALRPGTWNLEDRRELAACLTRTTTHLRNHVYAEDQKVFTMVAEHLSPEASATADEALAKMEADPEYQVRRKELTRLVYSVAGLSREGA